MTRTPAAAGPGWDCAPVEGRQTLLPAGVRTALFGDVVGSSELIERLGDERWAALLCSYRRRVQHAMSRAERDVEVCGDGFMALFASAADAVGAAVDLLDEMAGSILAVRMGMHCGPVIEVEGGYVGRTLHVASRVTDLASGGEILVTDAVRSALLERSCDVRVGGPRLVHLRGLSGQRVVLPLRPGAPPRRAIVLDQSPALVTTAPSPGSRATSGAKTSR